MNQSRFLVQVVVFVLVIVSAVNAQRRPRGGATTPSASPSAAPAQAPATTRPTPTPAPTAPATTRNGRRGARTPVGANNNVVNNPVSNVGNTATTSASSEKKVLYDTSSTGSGIGEKTKVSLRTESAIQRSLVKDRKPLEYENLREDDAVYSTLVWREIDCREKINRPFLYNGKEDNGDQRFFSILMQAVLNPDSTQKVSAFSVDDDRFTTEISAEKLLRDFAFDYDTTEVMQADGSMAVTVTKKAKLNLDSVYKYKLKEQYIFDKEASRMFVRIIGICPIARMKPSAGAQAVDKPLFWIYYPDLRPTLAKYEAFNEKNFSGRMSWEEVFESRFFSSYITKTSLNNNQNIDLKTLYQKNPMLRLYEGEKIKEKIFNYEQDLWSY
jgi:gliding motility associated protien GldN